MHIQSATGQVKVQGTWHPLVEVSLLQQGEKHDDDRFFLKEPIAVPGTSYSRKSFKRSELQGYKKA